MKKVFMVFACVLCTLCLNDSNDTSITLVHEAQPGESIDHIVVAHFHRVKQCTCCINIGKWAEETIKEYFPDEYASGELVYMDVCIEENMEIANKYNAYGASLFINVVKEGNETITEDTKVWDLCFDHLEYVEYFKQMLADLLGE